MSRIEEESKTKRIKSSTYIVSCFMLLFWVYFIFDKGLRDIAQVADVGVLISKIIVVVMGVLAFISTFRLMHFMAMLGEESSRANRAEYLLHLISKGKSYSHIESTYTGSLGAHEKLRYDTQDWIADEGPEAFLKERSIRTAQAIVKQK